MFKKPFYSKSVTYLCQGVLNLHTLMENTGRMIFTGKIFALSARNYSSIFFRSWAYNTSVIDHR